MTLSANSEIARNLQHITAEYTVTVDNWFFYEKDILFAISSV